MLTPLRGGYNEIVRIKRTEFFDLDEGNVSVEECVNNFVSYLNSTYNFDQEKMEGVINSYKKDVYSNVRNMFNTINQLYLNVFTEEVINALKDEKEDSYDNNFEEYNEPSDLSNDIPVMPTIPEDFTIPEIPDINSVFGARVEEEEPEANIEAPKMEIPEVEPISVKPEEVSNKKKYDVDEILKIAKSPVVSIPEEPVKETNNNYISVTPLKRVEETESIEPEIDEREIVEEMIRRLNKRLNDLNARQEKYKADEKKVADDEKFVNELIENSNNKKEELDRLEQELNDKEKELSEKKSSLDKKISDIMPFANAVLKSE